MRYLLKLAFWLLPFCVLSGCSKTEARPEKPEQPEPEKATVIYLVRHAEKSNNSPTDPDLSAAGKTRAEALKNKLANEPVTAIFSTNYKRTEQTAQPLAQLKNLPITTYDAGNLKPFADKVLAENKHQTVLIVGHSNTVLEIIEAFNLPRPVHSLSESDYDHLFKITIPENGEPKAEVSRYGN